MAVEEWKPRLIVTVFTMFGLALIICSLVDDFEWWLKRYLMRREMRECAQRLIEAINLYIEAQQRPALYSSIL